MASEPRIISFDADGMRGYAKKNIASAQKLIEEAIGELQSASVNSNWSCPERDQINNSLRNDIAKKLSKIKDTALGGISSALISGAARFDEWEARGMRQEGDVSDRLRNDYGYSGTEWGTGGKTTLPTLQVPKWGAGDYATQAARVITAGLGMTLGAFFGGLLGVTKSALSGAFSGGIRDMDPVGGAFKEGVPGGIEGFLGGSAMGAKASLEAFDKIFGTKEEIVRALDPDSLAARAGGSFGADEKKLVNTMVSWMLKFNFWK
jgi:hypothetical protein